MKYYRVKIKGQDQTDWIIDVDSIVESSSARRALLGFYGIDEQDIVEGWSSRKAAATDENYYSATAEEEA